MIEITGLPDVKKLIITDKQIYSRNISGVNVEPTESPVTMAMELSVSFILILRVKLYRAAMFIVLRNERLNELEAVTEKNNILQLLTRFWVQLLPFPGR